MKIVREGSKIIMEVEESDCAPGNTLEMEADMIMSGIKAAHDNPAITQRALEYLERDPVMVDEAKRSLEDFRERWEL